MCFLANAAAAAMNNNTQATNKSNNAAILSLLNSTPANIAQRKVQSQRISLNASIPPRVISHGNVINVPNTTGQVCFINLLIIGILYIYRFYIYTFNIF